ncbi:MAG TPA: F0F1 ATP synthase subunit B [Anaerovoracaceae bacterium]|nr:F0F1 ATP synthase subunit B [Anaerovoracaceae bacterium]
MNIYTELIEFNWTMIFIWLTVLVLYLVMKHFFFEKIHNFMEKRTNQIKEAFENAEQTNQAASEKMLDYQRKIDDIEAEARDIVREAKLRADVQAKSIIDDANQKAAERLQQAEKEIESEKLRAIGEMREQIAALAILAAQKVLEQQLAVSGQDELIDQIIREVEGSTWQN